MKFLAVDIETTGLMWRDSILTVGAAWDAPTGIETKAWSISMADLYNAPSSPVIFTQELLNLCQAADVIAMHNTTFDLSYLMGSGYIRAGDVKGKIFDTLVTARMTGPRNSLSLDNLCRDYSIGESWWQNLKSKRGSLGRVDVETVLRYNQEDAKNTLLLAHKLWDESIAIYGQEFTLHESDFCRLLAEVRVRGKKLDLVSVKEYWRTLTLKRRQVLQEILWPNQITGPNDRTNLLRYLKRKNYSDTQLVYTEKGNESFSDSALTQIMEKASGEVKEVLEAVLEIRHTEKILSTYIVPYLEEHADDGGYIHASYTVGGTVTYRLSSQNPNAQNVPRELSGHLWEPYTSADYSQAELRLATAYAQEKSLAKAFGEGADIHNETARLMFGEVTPERRKIAKNINFAVLYGGGARTLEERYDVPYDDGVRFIQKHRKIYPQLHKFTRLAEEAWKERGYIRLVSGKRIYATQDDLRRAYKAFNNLIQGGIAELVKDSMLKLDARGAKIVGQVHDSIEIESGSTDDETIREVMESVLPENISGRTNPAIKLKVDIEVKGVKE